MRWFKSKREEEIIELAVPDMRCTNCEATVKMALGKVNRVRRVKVNRRQKRVVVTVDPDGGVTMDELLTAVAVTGYRAEPA